MLPTSSSWSLPPVTASPTPTSPQICLRLASAALVHSGISINNSTIKLSRLEFIEGRNANSYYGNLGTVEYWCSHALISDWIHKQLIHSCNFCQQNVSASYCVPMQ
ncbi:hypothetical protein MLD38_000225 [Melastoma candidum]|uniref:Uncharacterized protein n=1 Tax=Melastoma candidum TaxID=119954 RepID=A0ACB9SEB3_9MYRT|nr:hypothetical protein MLD38_000225 [Melastoma candidum]